MLVEVAGEDHWEGSSGQRRSEGEECGVGFRGVVDGGKEEAGVCKLEGECSNIER